MVAEVQRPDCIVPGAEAVNGAVGGRYLQFEGPLFQPHLWRELDVFTRLAGARGVLLGEDGNRLVRLQGVDGEAFDTGSGVQQPQAEPGFG